MSTSNLSGPNSRKSIIKSTSVLSAGTLTSRILGFIRDIVLARLLGTGFRADAFFVALKIPNLFRDFVGEGATNAAIVPVFSQYKEKETPEAFWKFVSVVFALGLIVLSLLTLVGIMLTPVIVRVVAPGFMENPQQLELTIRLTKFMFPYLIFIGLTAYSIGLLYTFRSFMVPAFSPCFFNIAIIGSAFWATRGMEEPVFGLAAGVLLGGVLQLLVQFRPLMKIGFQLKWPEKLDHPGARKIGRLLVPRMLGSGVYQLTVLVDTFCASLAAIVGVGGISAIYYANRIIQFPMGIFGVALASAVLPSLSNLAAKNDMEAVRKTIVFALENIFFVMCPTMVILFLLANPIIHILFERGEFNEYSTLITSNALAFYALGLFSFGGIKILVTAFHALHDTKTPVIVAAICLVINALLNFILMFPLKVSGIALASAIAGTVDFLILFYIMNRRLGGLDSRLKIYVLKVTCASLATGIFEYWAWQVFHLPEITKLFLTGSCGFIFYGAVCLMMQVEQAQKIQKWLQKGFPQL